MKIGKKIPSTPTEYSEEEQTKRKEMLNFKDVNIFINTNFKRNGQPILVLAACESMRSLPIIKEDLLFKTEVEIFNIIGELCKNHYKESEGVLKLWGKIESYIYKHKDNKDYVFDTNGEYQEYSKDVRGTKATLHLK